MIASIDPRETSSTASAFNGKSSSGSVSETSPFEELFSTYFASQANASTDDAQKSAFISKHSSVNKFSKDVKTNGQLQATKAHSFNIHSRENIFRKDASEINSVKDTNEKFSQEKPEGFARNSLSGNNSNEYMLKKSFKIVRELDSKGDVTVTSELSALREDGTVGSFWQSIDDETATDMIDALKEISPDELAATLSLVRSAVP
ncbi:MAG TPA: hypothetical protein PKM25_09150, partial [Candidatus Ozemobacteraceae bacterium]|nr:hypothetical protein [Candidatus Ozemobacteraceae bacterium]